MNPEHLTAYLNGIDADKVKRQHVERLLDRLATGSHVPSKVRLQATKRLEDVQMTHHVGDNGDWIKVQWARYMTCGSIEVVLGVLLVVLLLTHSWPWLMFLAGIAASYGTWMVTRNVRRRRVLTSKRLPKA